ncbi:MAG: molybdopterin molybdotransferase MoeA [Roseomonas sp.]|nr:molybdopterin molybdotransferase MoeA [Roseomonas sp.]
MAQLSDDCFAFGGPLMSVEEAQALIEARIPPAEGAERVTLRAAIGRVLAEDLRAVTPLPPFFNSAVDGYAFRHADLAAGAETRLPIAARLQAGQAAHPIAPGTAIRIFTGAPMPDGADTVMMQEDARVEGGAVLLAAGLKRGANCRPAGEDVATGVVALPAGRRLGPAEIGLAAALGFSDIPVRKLVRVGVFSTGDELAEPGQPLGPAQTYDSNRFTLLALLAGLPVEAVDLGILPDEPAATAAALAQAAAGHDLLLTSGGVSTGEADHVKAAIGQGGRLVFWRLAIKPGRPAAMGVLPKAGGNFASGGTPVVGLPGNPVAAVVTFLHLARPLVLRLAGALPDSLPRFTARADFAYRKKAGRREYVRVRLDFGPGLPVARKYAREGAGLLTSLTESDAFAELPEDVTAVAPGDELRILPFRAAF